MNKSGITELKRTFKPDNTAIDFVVTAFIRQGDGGAELASYEKRRLLNMEDEEIFKYLEVAKNSLSGKIDKNLLNIDFSVESEAAGGSQDRLMELKESGLKDDKLVKDFIERIISSYTLGEQYMLTLYHGNYDIPIKTKDKMSLDESEEVYEFILGSISPLKLEKAGLYYDAQDNIFKKIEQKLVVDKPVSGFLFPAFNDRTTDIHQMLYYTKKADDIHPELINALSGEKAPLPADVQKNIFENIISEVAGKTTFEEEKTIHEKVLGTIQARQFKGEDLIVDKKEIYKILTDSIEGGIEEAEFEKAYKTALEMYDNSNFSLDNLVDTNAFKIQMADVKIQVNPDKKDIVEQVEINGGKYFAIPVAPGVEINGKSIKGGEI